MKKATASFPERAMLVRQYVPYVAILLVLLSGMMERYNLTNAPSAKEWGMRKVIRIPKRHSKKRFRIGDTVIVPDPGPYDMHSHSFVGTVKAVGRTMAMVADQEGNVYDIEKDRLEKI